MLWWLWLLVGFALLLAELVTPGGLYFLFFGSAALCVGLMAGLQIGGPPWVHWLLFSLLSIIALSLFRQPLLRKLQHSKQHVEVDGLVGEIAMAMEDIPVGAVGKAELRGTSWSAKNVSPNQLAKGQRCTVEKVEGLLLWLKG